MIHCPLCYALPINGVFETRRHSQCPCEAFLVIYDASDYFFKACFPELKDPINVYAINPGPDVFGIVTDEAGSFAWWRHCREPSCYLPIDQEDFWTLLFLAKAARVLAS